MPPRLKAPRVKVPKDPSAPLTVEELSVSMLERLRIESVSLCYSMREWHCRASYRTIGKVEILATVHTSKPEMIPAILSAVRMVIDEHSGARPRTPAPAAARRW